MAEASSQVKSGGLCVLQGTGREEDGVWSVMPSACPRIGARCFPRADSGVEITPPLGRNPCLLDAPHSPSWGLPAPSSARAKGHGSSPASIPVPQPQPLDGAQGAFSQYPQCPPRLPSTLTFPRCPQTGRRFPICGEASHSAIIICPGQTLSQTSDLETSKLTRMWARPKEQRKHQAKKLKWPFKIVPYYMRCLISCSFTKSREHGSLRNVLLFKSSQMHI